MRGPETNSLGQYAENLHIKGQLEDKSIYAIGPITISMKAVVTLFEHHLKVLLTMRERKYAADCFVRMCYFAFPNIAPLNFHARPTCNAL